MVDDKAQALFASTSDAIALVNGQLLVGKLQIGIDHTGTLLLAQPAPAPVPKAAASGTTSSTATNISRTSCSGRFRYTSSTAGAVDLRCNDGTSVDMTIALLSVTRGYGYGQNAAGPASMTFGLTPQAARAYLLVPAGKQLKDAATAPFLELL
jgi:hypothetical protein